MIEFEHKGKKYTFSNVMEDTVLEKVRQKISSDADMCKCQKCYYDVCALVLNNMELAKYTTSDEGTVIMRAPLDVGIMSSGQLMVEIAKAISLVGERPNH